MIRAKQRKFRQPRPYWLVIPPDAGKEWVEALRAPYTGRQSSEMKELMTGEIGHLDCGINFITSHFDPPRHNLTQPSDVLNSTCTKCGRTFNLEDPRDKDAIEGYCTGEAKDFRRQAPKLRFVTDMEGVHKPWMKI